MPLARDRSTLPAGVDVFLLRPWCIGLSVVRWCLALALAIIRVLIELVGLLLTRISLLHPSLLLGHQPVLSFRPFLFRWPSLIE